LTDDGDIADSGKGGAGEAGGATMTFATTERTKTRNTGALRSSLLLPVVDYPIHPSTFFLVLLLLFADNLPPINPATVDPSLLATSNGYRMSEHELAGTSKPPSGAPCAAVLSMSAVLGAVALGVVGVVARLM
jgi:hypothetical protein